MIYEITGSFSLKNINLFAFIMKTNIELYKLTFSCTFLTTEHSIPTEKKPYMNTAVISSGTIL
jgi:hypothetical protein